MLAADGAMLFLEKLSPALEHVNSSSDAIGTAINNRRLMLMKVLVRIVLKCMLAGCAFEDARTARSAQQKLIGWSELDLEACLGAPDQHSTFGHTDILTYFSNSTTNKDVSLGLPFLGGFSLAGGGGGCCHAIVRVKEGRVAEVRYSGETNAMLAPDAYCAPIVRNCVNHPEHVDTSSSISPQATPRTLTDIPH